MIYWVIKKKLNKKRLTMLNEKLEYHIVGPYAIFYIT